MPKLSIITPTFNSAGSIERCLHSISRQTFTDFEVVIQDGGSTDNTIDLINCFQEANAGLVIKICQEKDKGTYDAMNKGMARAGGEWLFFLGSDDELFNENVLSQFMAKSDNSTSGVMYGNAKIIGETGWAKNGQIYDGCFDIEKFLKKNICHQAIFYRAELIKNMGGFNLKYKICADWDFNMRCWAMTKFHYVDLIVVNFYAGGTSSGNRPDEHFAAEVADNVLKYFRFSIFDPVVNTPSFVGYSDILKMQQSKKKLRRAAVRVFKGCARRLKLAFNNP